MCPAHWGVSSFNGELHVNAVLTEKYYKTQALGRIHHGNWKTLTTGPNSALFESSQPILKINIYRKESQNGKWNITWQHEKSI